jgi:hypothetical protein
MKPRKMWELLIILMAAALFACSGQSSSKSQREPKRVLKDANDLAGSDANRPRLALSAPEPLLEVVASSGSCAPTSKNELAVASCYKDVPCRGQHARTKKGGDVECWCYSQKGGCGEGTVCCSASRRCEKIETCYAP